MDTKTLAEVTIAEATAAENPATDTAVTGNQTAATPTEVVEDFEEFSLDDVEMIESKVFA